MDAEQAPVRLRLPDGTRSHQSPWVWRGFFVMALVAGGICIGQLDDLHHLYPLAWGVIAVGWFACSMYLWRKHVVWMDSEDDLDDLPVGSSANITSDDSTTRGPARTPSKLELRGGKSARRR